MTTSYRVLWDNELSVKETVWRCNLLLVIPSQLSAFASRVNLRDWPCKAQINSFQTTVSYCGSSNSVQYAHYLVSWWALVNKTPWKIMKQTIHHSLMIDVHQRTKLSPARQEDCHWLTFCRSYHWTSFAEDENSTNFCHRLRGIHVIRTFLLKRTSSAVWSAVVSHLCWTDSSELIFLAARP